MLVSHMRAAGISELEVECEDYQAETSSVIVKVCVNYASGKVQNLQALAISYKNIKIHNFLHNS